MILPDGMRGAAFGAAGDGNGRDDREARSRISRSLGIPEAWAAVRQVHGADVIWAEQPGTLGDADALATTVPGLPLTVATADCLPVVLESPAAVGIAHAGWRGVAAGVVDALRASMAAAGHYPVQAAIGPGIGPCCFEVGPEVTAALPDAAATTEWGTPSVDLPGALGSSLEGLEVWRAPGCTRCDAAYHSYRRNGTAARQVAVAWLPA